MIDGTLLKVLSTKEGYGRYRKSVPMQVLDTRTQALIKDLDAWYRDTDKDATSPEFSTFLGVQHRTLGPDDLGIMMAMVRTARDAVDPMVEANLMSRLAASDAAYKQAQLLESFNNGGEVDLYAGMANIMQDFEAARGVVLREECVDEEDLDLWLTREMDESGLHWGLPCIERNWRPLRGGDFGVIGARVGVGKTTLITQLEAYWAGQLPAGHPVLHMNNEGPDDRIMQRAIQSSLRMTIPEMVKHGATEVQRLYREQVGGKGKILVKGIHGWNTVQLEELIKQKTPGIVIVDMMEHVRLGQETTHGGTRTDQLLEAVAQSLRIMAVKYDIPIVGTVQLSGDAQGIPYPVMSMVKDSKTGIQAALDFFLTVGMSDDPMLDSSRFIGGCKSKINRPGGKTSPQTEVTMISDRGYYKEPE